MRVEADESIALTWETRCRMWRGEGKHQTHFQAFPSHNESYILGLKLGGRALVLVARYNVL